MKELTDREEEILEHLWIKLEERKEGVEQGALRDSDELRSLETQGLVKLAGESLTLTERGREEGRLCIRRHRLAERLLHDILDSEEAELHAASCKFEHGLHRGLEERVCTILGHPKTCPHGKPIPRGECCKQRMKEAGQLITTLAALKSGEKGVVAYLHSEDRFDLRKLMAMGVIPGTAVTLVQRFPSYLFEIGHTQFAIDEDMAKQIYVRRTEGK